MNISQYLEQLNKRYKGGISKEHSYRGDLEELIKHLVTDIDVTNEPANVTDCGNPDYVITKKDIPIGYIEAKDIGKDLNSKTYKEQFTRYRKALDNLIITDYIYFQFFTDGELVAEISIGEIQNGQIVPLSENFARFENLIKEFCTFIGQTIRSPKKLAEMMAGKARLLQNTLETALSKDIEENEKSELKAQYDTFKHILIHDLTAKGFADIYAQTLAYGMFAARYHDNVLETFSRQEAAEKIPKSNPFLRMLFDYVAGTNIDDRIKHTVDNLADVFKAVDLRKILSNYGKSIKTQDPIVHFYETFLAEYDSKLRKAKGVWYTPKPVVSFIVRAVDEVLKNDFALPQGLADTSKTTINIDSQTTDKRSKTGYAQIKKEVHKVQVLDPATGTGTFLAEAIQFIYENNFAAMQGAWSGYVEEHLIPRLNGFELLMASYAMAHLKLDMLLTETGYKPKQSKAQRLNVFLTNSLEEHHPDTGTLFANWLSNEANQANQIKKDTPVMVVMGNPPYSGESANKGQWIMELMEDYKKEPAGGKLQERNPKWINDDYVKFMRYGQHYIEKNGSGILAFINPHGFLDNPTFRGMRYSLLKTYDKIYTIDLHGNSKKKEVCPDGSKDENVFDIMQGVSINILVKTGAKKNNELGEVYHADLFGKRNDKYEFLSQNSLRTIQWSKLENIAPQYYFVQKDWELKKRYDDGFSLKDLFKTNGVGMTTAHDGLVISENRQALIDKFINFRDSERNENLLHEKFNVKKKKGWDFVKAWDIFQSYTDNDIANLIQKISYRPFDSQYIIYQGDVVWRTVEKIMKHMLKDNIGLVTPKINQEDHAFFISNNIIAHKLASAYDSNSIFPLYLYPDDDSLDSARVPNLDMTIVKDIEQKLGLEFVAEKTHPTDKSAPLSRGESTTLANQDANSPSLKGLKSETDGVVLKSNETPSQAEGFGNGAEGFATSKMNSHTREGGYLTDTSNNAKDSRLHGNDSSTFTPIDLLDYIYGVLHSPSYRKKYKEFLKIDFPRVPFPTIATFWQLVELGGKLRQIHLLESPIVSKYITSYPIDGSNVVEGITKTSYKDGKVYINKEQYFENVPQVAWEFYIGGYQPAQKWLKDRKGRELSFEDILHYQKIIVALTETDKVMQEIDKIEV